MTMRCYRPKAIIEYRREAYVVPENDTRITFDREIHATESCADLFDPGLCLYPVMDQGQVVLEVKFTEFLPDLVRRALPPRSSELTAVSKFVLGCEKTGYLYAESIHY